MTTSVFAGLAVCAIYTIFPAVGITNMDEDVSTAGEDIITDLVTAQKITTNIICITSLDYVDTLTQLDWGDNTRIILDYATVNKHIISKVQTVHITDNKLPLYLISLPKLYEEQRLMEIITEIRSVNQAGRIIVIYRGKVSKKELPKGVYNIYMLVPVVNVDLVLLGYEMYEVCKYCDRGEDLFEKSNTWRYKTGFRKIPVLRNSFRDSFYGTTLKVGFPYPFGRNVYIIGKDDSGNDILDGITYRNYEHLADMLNVKFKYKNPRDGVKKRLVLKNKNKVGVMRDLHKGDVDLIGGGWGGRYARYKSADFSTYTIRFSQKSIISVKPEKGIQWYGVVQSFHWNIWVCTTISVPLVGVVLYIFRRFSISPDKAASLRDDLWDSIVIMSWDSIICHNVGTPVCILLSCYMFAVLTIVSAYMGALTSSLVAVKYLTPPIDRFTQVWDSDLKILSFGVFTESYRDYFREVPDIDDKIFRLDVKKGENTFLKLMQVFFAHTDKYVLLGTYRTYIYYVRKYFPDKLYKLYTSKEGVGASFAYIMYLPSYPEKEILNKKLTLMHDMDIMKLISFRYTISTGTYRRAIRSTWSRPVQETKLVALHELKLGFAFLLTSYLIAFILFLVEIIWHRTKMYKKSLVN